MQRSKIRKMEKEHEDGLVARLNSQIKGREHAPEIVMKYSSEKPPNWERIVRSFGSQWWDQGLIVTWGRTYFSKNDIEPDFVAHEATHARQQEAYPGGIEGWWERYYIDTMFRLLQEVEAYQDQVAYLKSHTELMSRNQRKMRIKYCARALSSELYGNIISYDKAMTMLK